MRRREKTAILVADDDRRTRRTLAFDLENAGYVVHEADLRCLAPADVARHEPDLVILSLDMQDASSAAALRALRPPASAPILILSALAHEEIKVAALDAGADDYMTRPFSMAELLARLRAILRRVRPTAAETHLKFGPIELDMDLRRVLLRGQPVKLTATEYALLRLLVSNRDKVLTHRQMLRELWGMQAIASTNYLRIYMMRLRRKLGAAGYFQTESGVGYRFVSAPPSVETQPEAKGSC